MANDSSTGGYLVPYSTPPETDSDLDAIFQQLITGLTGISGSLVRPRWQPVVPQQPEPSTNWVAIGVTSVSSGPYPAIEHDGNGDGASTLYRHETIEALASFYGPNAQQYAEQCRDGLYLNTTGDVLRLYRMGLVSASQIRTLPDLLNQQWRKRYDITITLRRQVVRTYPIFNIESAEVTIDSSQPDITKSIDISQP